MIQAGRTFRIFVSSTFSDLKEERNALHKYVFPQLREFCMQHGCRFQAIDLRWGVSEEAGHDQQTMEICLEEIARCQKISSKPNFMILLGDRYGWQPAPSEIPANEFDEIIKRVSQSDREFLLFDEKQTENNKSWYRKDENAVPPVYCLQPREGDYKDYTKWSVEEKRLCSILQNAISTMNLDEEARTKYISSATEQEIIKGALKLPKDIPDAKEHVFGFFREIANLEDIKREAEYPHEESSTSNEVRKKNPAKDFIDIKEIGEFDAEAYQKFQQLKEKLDYSLEENIHRYTAKWNQNGLTLDHIGTLPEEVLERMRRGDSVGDPNTLCVAVWNRLYTVIKAEIDKIERLSPLDQEIDAHEKFRNERAKFFIGRKDHLDKIEGGVSNCQYVIVHGESGVGKSALMAKAIEITKLNHRNAKIIARFIGATSPSSDPRSLLEGLCQEIARENGGDEAAVPLDYKSLVIKFPEMLALATEEKPLIIFLDALDQFQKAGDARYLEWLPSQLPDTSTLWFQACQAKT